MKKGFYRSLLATTALMGCIATAVADNGISDAANIYIIGNNDSSPGAEGVFLRSNGGSSPQARLDLTSDGGVWVAGNSLITLNAPTTTINSPTTNINGNTAISGTERVTGLATLNGGVVVNGTSTLNGATTVTGATNINVTGGANTNIGSLGSANTITGTTNTITGATNTINGLNNTINGTNTVVANVATSSMTLANANQTGAVVNANGQIVSGPVAGSTASLTTVNGGATFANGIVATSTQTVVSGGSVRGTSMTLNDTAATFSNGANGGPVRVTGVADGAAAYDAVNVRQLRGVFAGVAGAAAMANIPGVDPGKRFALGAAVGGFKGQGALAVGASLRVSDNAQIKASISSSANNDSGARNTAYAIGSGLSF